MKQYVSLKSVKKGLKFCKCAGSSNSYVRNLGVTPEFGQKNCFSAVCIWPRIIY